MVMNGETEMFNVNSEHESKTSMDGLEAMLAAMETKEETKQTNNNAKVKLTKGIHSFAAEKDEEVQDHSFAKYELDVYDKPLVKNGFSAAASRRRL